MKNLMLTTALVVATGTGAAVAQDSSEQIRDLVSQELATYEMDVDIDMLSDEEVSQLYLISTGEDSASEKENRFRQVLSDTEMAGDADMATQGGDEMMVQVEGEDMARSQLVNSVDQMLTTYELDVDVDSLSDQQLSELFLLRSSSDSGTIGSDDAVEQQINEILDM